MPSFKGLSNDEVGAIAAYIVSGKNDIVRSPVPDPSIAGYMLGVYSRFLDVDGYPLLIRRGDL